MFTLHGIDMSGDPNPFSGGDGGVSTTKGKSVAFVGSTTPGAENGVRPGSDLVEKVSELQNELFEYQYNMGLLLIEKRDWASRYEEIRHALDETNDALKRQQTAHLISVTDVDKREENLRRTLGVEKQCVVHLEKALHEMRSENAEIKFTADSKLAEANALIASVEEKSLEIEEKLRAADAKHAEVSRKSSEIERKAQELEFRESALRREQISLISERKTKEKTLFEQREDLVEWERKLKEGEERLAKDQILLNQREERANEYHRVDKEKEKNLEETQKRIDAANLTLKIKEEDIRNRLTILSPREKESDAIRENLDANEKKLIVLEEKLNEKERVEIQKLVDEHNVVLEVKKREFELKVEEKRRSVDDEVKNKLNAVEKKETEINHMKEKVAKREQALDKKVEKFKEKEKDFESKMKTLKERENVLKSEEKNLENDNKQLLADKEDLLSLKAEVEKIETLNKERILKIHEEESRLKVSEEERYDFLRLQSKLKEEMDKCRVQEELISKEANDLKQQKQNFEREWEELDEKRNCLEKELKKIVEQKEEVENCLHEKEMLFINEKEREFTNINYLRDVGKREMDEMKIVRHKIEKDRDEIDSNKKRLEEEQVEIRKDINELVVLGKKMEDQREQFVKEKTRFISFVDKQKSCKNCGEVTSEFLLSDLQSLQEIKNEQVLPLSTLADNYAKDGAHTILSSKISPGVGGSGSPLPDRTISWLQKCTSKIFKISPNKKIENSAIQLLRDGSGKQVDAVEPSNRLGSAHYEPQSSFASVDDSFDQRSLSDETSTRKFESGQEMSIENHSNIDSKAMEVQEYSQRSRRGRQWRGRGMSRVGRTSSLKAVIQESKALLGGALKPDMVKPDVNAEDSSFNKKGAPKRARKRSRGRLSQIIFSDDDDDDNDVDDDSSEGNSESVVASKPRKRQQTRYNLRQPKVEIADGDAKEKEEDVINGQKIERENFHSKAADTPYVDIASENGGSSRFEQPQTAVDSQVVGNMTTMSEDVNGTREGLWEHGNIEARGFDGDDDDDDDDGRDDPEHPGNASVRKKLWTFLTT